MAAGMEWARWIAVISGLLGGLAPAGAQEIDPAQRQAFERIIREYLLSHPELILEAQQALEERQQAQRAERVQRALAEQRSALFEDPQAPWAGNAAGDVTIVEFFDYRCGYCKRATGAVKAALAQDPGVRLVYREFPILGPASIYAARAALAAARQGKYVEFHDALMAADDPDETTVRRIAGELSLDAARLLAEMDLPAVAQAIEKSYALAQALEINGTPAFIVGGTLIPGAISAEGLLQQVRVEREKLGRAAAQEKK
jgi:protein-disulfide isomerase